MIFYEDTTIEDVLKTFEDFYVKKDYSNALLILQRHADQLPSDLLHYNLGTVYLKMENLGLARYHFLLARAKGLSRVELDQNQSLIEQRLEVERLERPLNMTDHLIKASLFAHEGLLTSMGLLILLIGLVVLRKGATMMKILLWCLLMAIPFGYSLWVDTWPLMVAIRTQPVTEGPSAIFRETTELPEGVMVIAKGEGEWREVIYPSRFAGWIKSEALKKLE